MTQTSARPYVSIYVAIDTPDAPRLDGKTVRSVSWSAHRYPREGAPIEFVVTAHHPHADDAEGCLTTMLETKSLASPDLPDWVPWPPANWLASLELPSPETCHGQNGLCGNDETLIDGLCEQCRNSAALLRTYGRSF